MAFAAGVYEISSAISPDFFLGRLPTEDRSLLPKSIVTLPRSGDEAPSSWVVSESDNGTFILRAAKAPTTNIDGRLQDVLLDSPPPTNWKITPVPQHGENACVVTLAENEENGWNLGLPNNEIQPFQPIFVSRLIVASSEPPTGYLPSEVFVFNPIDPDR